MARTDDDDHYGHDVYGFEGIDKSNRGDLHFFLKKPIYRFYRFRRSCNVFRLRQFPRRDPPISLE
ncbi:hypothetical protein DERF_008450 [Dermatophagoides farinae]|uniref:Uncharacterized protein n=1 Tax=Dermatophagoides farinae TaxID=6954 RepID=A0A922I0D8_DERFA|nr:hypothetical protein DERF_008450 [Dermatophagoides farinae]